MDINIGPDSYGNIPDYDKNVIMAMGEWLQTNKEAIKETHPWSKKQQDKDPNICYNVNGNYLYVIFLDWPSSNKFELKNISPADVSNIRMLGLTKNCESSLDNGILKISSPNGYHWKSTEDDRLIFTNSDGEPIDDPDIMPNPLKYAWVFKIDIGEDAAPYLSSLTHGEPKDDFQAGRWTEEVTPVNNWRWSEHFYGFGGIEAILEIPEKCGGNHIYAYGENSGDTVEYLMEFGGDYSQLVLRGIADQPAPVRMKIYIDGHQKATAEWDDNDRCNDLAFVKIGGIERGTHAIAVQYINDLYDPNTNPPEDRNFYLDALMVIANDDEGIPVFVGDDIQAAVNDNPDGTTFIIKATDRDGNKGIHRMQQINPKDGNSFIGEDGAIMSGSDLLTSWETDGTHWFHKATGQSSRIINGDCEGYDTFGTGPCTFPEDLYMDDSFMSHVETKGELKSGEFYFDYDESKVYIKDDPAGHKMEFSSKHFAFGYDTGDLENKPQNVTIKNLVIEKYASPAQCGAIGYFRPADGWIIEDNEVKLNHGVGIKFKGGAVVRNNHIHDNGQMGIGCGDGNPEDRPVGDESGWAGGNGGEGSLVEKNEINNNGVLGFNMSWEGGGSKFSQATNLTLRENNVHHNNGFGLWSDFSYTGLVYENNVVEHNLLAGIHHEISEKAIIRGNKLQENGKEGGNDTRAVQILIVNSSDVEIHNNEVIAGENLGGIFLNQDNRNREGIQMYTHNVDVHHNKIILMGPSGKGVCGGQASWNRNDFWENGNNLFDYDVYYVDNSSSEHWRWGWDGDPSTEDWPPYIDFAGFQAEGQELNGLCNGARAMYFNDGLKDE